ncbi:hypothetical protein BAUCODRAFT_534851 [Baudoinia panamericana UAMH 10762]|uniref:Uncharacterized protein n=1 Tax=Baudoinia panamericana (strain UAMH 10762) TaxID=717646 RepID=M2N888_BAUPA|nr:uncharacterized protein BAUCODRAFT_534851 [Baudoinia panamericana UAMH 10762]EMC95309.1 hypothetical protein BAUCODRAFT_534851 [Baudoinia panamericana UAMH 10762]
MLVLLANVAAEMSKLHRAGGLCFCFEIADPLPVIPTMSTNPQQSSCFQCRIILVHSCARAAVCCDEVSCRLIKEGKWSVYTSYSVGSVQEINALRLDSIHPHSTIPSTESYVSGPKS